MSHTSLIPRNIQVQIDDLARECETYQPLVAIRCITYNHGPYVRDALEGFVMQQTNFPFVAIIHDDASTDETISVIKEYASRYPDIIKPLYEAENQYSKRNGSIRRIMNDACVATGAKYYALCEGDDYWTDPLKLQKQVDFLELHQDCSLCFHNVMTKTVEGEFKSDLAKIDASRIYSPNEIIRNWTIPTCSVLFRAEKIACDSDRDNSKFKFGDNVLFLTAAKYGQLYGINEYMGVYRKNIGGATVKDGIINWNKIVIAHTKALRDTFASIIDKSVCDEAISKNYVLLVRLYKQNPYQLFKSLFMGVKDGKWFFVRMAFKTWLLRKK